MYRLKIIFICVLFLWDITLTYQYLAIVCIHIYREKEDNQKYKGETFRTITSFYNFQLNNIFLKLMVELKVPSI